MRTVELTNGETIAQVTKVTEQDDGYVHIHTPGSGYRVVQAEEIEHIDELDPDE